MTLHTSPTSALTQSGFTPTQANALAAAIERSAAGAVDDLRHDLESWHIHLALYLLIQIGVVLLVMLLVQTMREPGYRALTSVPAHRTNQMSRPASAIHGESPVNLTRFAMFRA
ncbi:hypothetical protein ASG52_17600 [Methylobacterium sp. Leaf456]|uniref:hypothetical protein n=1 Tax=Methylobacterium sp. Leaf456 TaxID=1736382 RepID=UPI00070228F5|nr:hypothetical protein [Methylobacterium sp. Leaf456]KQT61049.1 hypothetical protein ASG52_17600 [Methylobacterium sp. Leaf456]